MRILIYGINFAPELIGVGKFTGEMAQWLAQQGHTVRVVTAPPFNPMFRVFPGFSAWRYRREEQVYGAQAPSRPIQIKDAVARVLVRSDPTQTAAGLLLSETSGGDEAPLPGRLSIFRCPVWVLRSSSAAKRALHLTSFAFSSFWSMLSQVGWRPQVVLVIEPTLLCAPGGWLTARLSGAKSCIHVQDLEADAAFDLGMLRSEVLRRIILAVEEKCLQAFDCVSTISEKMSLRLIEKGVESSRCLLFPNWVDTDVIFPMARPSPLRSELRIPEPAIVSLYSGTMAHKQGLDTLAQVVDKLGARDDLHFVFCGEGPAKATLTNSATRARNVHFLPLQPLERLNELLNVADVHLLPQRANAADLVMPSKLTGMLASGRPVVASAASGTQLAEVVDGRGIVVPPGDASAFAWAVDHLASHPALCEKLGRNARAYAVSSLEKNVVLRDFERELLNLASRPS